MLIIPEQNTTNVPKLGYPKVLVPQDSCLGHRSNKKCSPIDSHIWGSKENYMKGN